MNEDAVRGELKAAATALRSVLPASRRVGRLRYGPLFTALDGRPDRESYASAVELIYEGYLLHYRTSRVLAGTGAGHAAARLLAGDYFYANGLRLLAERNDIAGVDLLSRLMAACSYLRLVGAPFSRDDDLWAFTVAALAAGGAPGAPATASAFYAEFDTLVLNGRIDDVPRAVRTHAAALPLARRRPLDSVLHRREHAAAAAEA